MGIVYIAALIIGLGTILMQTLLAHAGGDGAGDAAGDGAGDGAGDAAGGHDLEPEADLDHIELGAGHGTALWSGVSVFFSFRFWIYGLLAFGMMGVPIHYLKLCGAVSCLLLSLLMGLASGGVSSLIFAFLKRGVSSSGTATEAVGRIGRVMVPLGNGRTGKIRIQLRGKTVDLLARSDSEELSEGAQVLIVEIRGTDAYVEPISDIEIAK